MYQRYTKDVQQWNEIMQNAPLDTDSQRDLVAKVVRQSSFVVEEANELHTAAKEDDLIEMLDGHLDVRFVNDQVGVYLEAMGVDLEGAWREVCRSNNSKFSSDLEMMKASQQHYFSQHVDVEIVESPVKGVYVLKRLSDGKIMKPLCFEEPNLRPFLPKYLRGAR